MKPVGEPAPAVCEVAEAGPPPPGEHGQLSRERNGQPNVARHAIDVRHLLTEQRDEAIRLGERAERERDRHRDEAVRWDQEVAMYDELIAAIDKAAQVIP